MAVLPDTDRVRSTPQSRRGIASVQNAGAVGRAVQGLGGVVSGIGDDIQDGIDEAAIKERDAYVSSQIRELLYNPDSGFTNLYGKDAVSRRAATLDKLEKMRDFSTEGMSNQGKSRLEGALNSRIETARQRIDVHTSGERRTWLQGASDARITAAFQDSLTEDGVFAEQFSVVEGEIRQTAQREGWSTEKTELEVDTRLSEMATMQVKKMAANDPESALEYLNKNPDVFLPSEALALKNTLEPMAKEAKGFRLGDAAFDGVVGVSTDYLAAIRTAESGGNDRAKNPLSSASGRYQFIASTWEEMRRKHPQLGLTRDGRFDPAQQERAIRAFTADNAKVLGRAGIEPTNANLYAAHFLGAGGAKTVLSASDGVRVASLVEPGVMSANPFLRGMTVSDFKAWSSRKGGGQAIGYSEASGDAMSDIMSITDPDVQKAALARFEKRTKIAEGQRKASIDAASQQVFELIEAGGSLENLPLDIIQTLGMDAVAGLRRHEAAKAAGEEVETDAVTYGELRSMQAENPAQFASVNLHEFADKLSMTDLKGFIDEQARGASPSKKISLASSSTLMTVAKRSLEQAGIDTTPEAGSVQSEQNAAMQERLLRWQDRFAEENNRAPTQLEMNDQVGRELVDVVIDPPWAFNEFEGSLLEVVGSDLTVEKLMNADTDVSIETASGEMRDVPSEVLAEVAAILEARGEPLSPQAILWELQDLMARGGSQ